MGTWLRDWIAQLAGRRVVVVGDVCLDEYVVGRARGLSREAPVPALQFVRHFTLPGAAANPARNVAALGGVPLLIGVVGDDTAGATLRQRLAEVGVDPDGLVVDTARQTTRKMRVLAEGSLRFPQQLVKIDYQDHAALAAATAAAARQRLAEMARGADAILVSDYRGGVVTADLAAYVAALARERRIPATVDSQGNLGAFDGFDVVKANQPDTERYLDRALASEDDFRQAGELLRSRLNARSVVITRGEAGLSVVEEGGRYRHIPAIRTEVFDVTGAGDTVIAVLTLALAAGVPLDGAARLANHAAGLVVRRLGNATVSPDELAASLASDGEGRAGG